MSKPAIALTALFLASCQTVPETEMAGQAPYKAAGTEPFWGLAIEKGGMKFSRAGEKDIRIWGYEARPSLNGWGYFSKRIAAEVTFVPCSDGMSDNTYKDTVTVIVDGVKYEGCGGGIVAPTKP
jgi:heat shock protein HslJ